MNMSPHPFLLWSLFHAPPSLPLAYIPAYPRVHSVTHTRLASNPRPPMLRPASLVTIVPRVPGRGTFFPLRAPLSCIFSSYVLHCWNLENLSRAFDIRSGSNHELDEHNLHGYRPGVLSLPRGSSSTTAHVVCLLRLSTMAEMTRLASDQTPTPPTNIIAALLGPVTVSLGHEKQRFQVLNISTAESIDCKHA